MAEVENDTVTNEVHVAAKAPAPGSWIELRSERGTTSGEGVGVQDLEGDDMMAA